jgi:hypothetical protein
MSDQSPKNAGICPAPTAEVFKMSAAVEARDLIASIAGPAAIGSKVKEAFWRVAMQTGLSQRRVRGIWNREAKAIRAEELDALRRAAPGRVRVNDIEHFAARIEALESRLAAIDPEFHRSTIDAARHLNRRVRRLAHGE